MFSGLYNNFWKAITVECGLSATHPLPQLVMPVKV